MNGYRAYYPTSLPHIGETMGATSGFLYAMVCHHAQSSCECTAGIPRLAAMTGTSVNTVKRHLRKLHDAGHITITERPGRPHRIVVVGWRAKEANPAHDGMTPSPPWDDTQPMMGRHPAHDGMTPSPPWDDTQPTMGHEQRGVTTRTNNEEERRDAPPPPKAIAALETRMVSVPRNLYEIAEGVTAKYGDDAAGEIMLAALADPWFQSRPITPGALNNALAKVPPPTSPAAPSKDAARLRGILSTTQRRHPDAPDDFIFEAVQAEARTILKRHNLSTLAAITAWLEKSNAA